MPGKIQVINVLVVGLQYTLVILLYYFLYRIVKIVKYDLTRLTVDTPEASFVRENDKLETGSLERPPRLIVVEDQQGLLSQSVFIISDNVTVGRSQHNTIVINDNFISHEHACISESKHNYLLTDLNSTNGTLVNGQRIKDETALADGDVIKLGAVTLKFER